MSLEKIVSVDQIEVVENGVVQVRTAFKIVENGQELSRTFHRHTIAPGMDCSKEDERVKAICAVVHTPEVVASYQAMIQAKNAEV